MVLLKTISDIAEFAGVSKSTVSRALNDNPAISKKTRKRIQQIAKEHQFEAHQGARRLSLNQSQTIALVYPESEHHRHMVTDPFFAELLKGITSAVGEMEYDLLVAQPRKDITKVMRGYIESKKADGIIYLGCCQTSSIENLVEREAAVISCGSDRYEYSCSVDCDNLDGGKKAAQHLLMCGCKEIAFIGGPQDRLETDLRYQGFSQELQRQGVKLNKENVLFGDYLNSSGHQLAKTILKNTPKLDGLFCCSDLMAIGAMEAMREQGIFAGTDVSVIGFDDIPFARFSSPPLTTIKQDIFKIGEILVDKLMQYMKDRIVSKSILPVELVVRKSTVSR